MTVTSQKTTQKGVQITNSPELEHNVWFCSLPLEFEKTYYFGFRKHELKNLCLLIAIR